MPEPQLIRPWTPTENPEDDSYVSPVVYHGANQLHESDSEVSVEDEPVFNTNVAAKARLSQLEAARVPVRFRSSQGLRDDALESAPEGLLYKAYQASCEPETKPPRRHKSAKVPEGDRGDRLPANNPYRLSQLRAPDGQLRSTRSSELLTKKDQSSSPISPRPSTAQPPATPLVSLQQVFLDDLQPHCLPSSPSDVLANAPLIQIPCIEVTDSLPSVTGNVSAPISILLINPNSTESITQQCLSSLSPPPYVTVYGFTAPHPAPTAIESQTDSILSTSVCFRHILPIAHRYDAFLVACFSHHPLIDALREELDKPVIGITEASIYTARMCGGKFGIITMGQRSSLLHEASVRNTYGPGDFFVGTASTIGVLQLDRRKESVRRAAKELQRRGADCVCLGCAGMSELKGECMDAVRMEDRKSMVIDGVAMAVHFLVGMVREGVHTPKATEGIREFNRPKS